MHLIHLGTIPISRKNLSLHRNTFRYTETPFGSFFLISGGSESSQSVHTLKCATLRVGENSRHDRDSCPINDQQGALESNADPCALNLKSLEYLKDAFQTTGVNGSH